MPEMLIGSCIIGQSGGPTSVINSTVYGAIKEALSAPEITNVYGAENGISGVINDRLFDMSLENEDELELLTQTPAAALGSCRYKLADYQKDESDYIKILEVFKKHDVRYFFYNGGNDSMDTCNKIDKYMKSVGWDCRVIGIPKTVDNDLFGTDHAPGYPSAAKYIATSTAEIFKDISVYEKGSIVVIEAMGRHAGWIAASAALAGEIGCGPDLVYLPEVPFDLDKFVADAYSIFKKNGKCLVVASEGIHYENGTYVSELVASGNDGFGHVQLGRLAAFLADVLKERTGVKTRGIELSLLQRCSAHITSQVDVDEAILEGSEAVKLAIAGESGKMVALKRDTDSDEYKCNIVTIALDEVANIEKTVPLNWINAEHNNVTQEYIRYALPLIGGERHIKTKNGLPIYANLKKIYVK